MEDDILLPDLSTLIGTDILSSDITFEITPSNELTPQLQPLSTTSNNPVSTKKRKFEFIKSDADSFSIRLWNKHNQRNRTNFLSWSNRNVLACSVPELTTEFNSNHKYQRRRKLSKYIPPLRLIYPPFHSSPTYSPLSNFSAPSINLSHHAPITSQSSGTQKNLPYQKYEQHEIQVVKFNPSGDCLLSIDEIGNVAIWNFEKSINIWKRVFETSITQPVVSAEWLDSSRKYTYTPSSSSQFTRQRKQKQYYHPPNSFCLLSTDGQFYYFHESQHSVFQQISSSLIRIYDYRKDCNDSKSNEIDSDILRISNGDIKMLKDGRILVAIHSPDSFWLGSGSVGLYEITMKNAETDAGSISIHPSFLQTVSIPFTPSASSSHTSCITNLILLPDVNVSGNCKLMVVQPVQQSSGLTFSTSDLMLGINNEPENQKNDKEGHGQQIESHLYLFEIAEATMAAEYGFSEIAKGLNKGGYFKSWTATFVASRKVDGFVTCLKCISQTLTNDEWVAIGQDNGTVEVISCSNFQSSLYRSPTSSISSKANSQVIDIAPSPNIASVAILRASGTLDSLDLSPLWIDLFVPASLDAAETSNAESRNGLEPEKIIESKDEVEEKRNEVINGVARQLALGILNEIDVNDLVVMLVMLERVAGGEDFSGSVLKGLFKLLVPIIMHDREITQQEQTTSVNGSTNGNTVWKDNWVWNMNVCEQPLLRKLLELAVACYNHQPSKRLQYRHCFSILHLSIIEQIFLSSFENLDEVMTVLETGLKVGIEQVGIKVAAVKKEHVISLASLSTWVQDFCSQLIRYTVFHYRLKVKESGRKTNTVEGMVNGAVIGTDVKLPHSVSSTSPTYLVPLFHPAFVNTIRRLLVLIRLYRCYLDSSLSSSSASPSSGVNQPEMVTLHTQLKSLSGRTKLNVDIVFKWLTEVSKLVEQVNLVSLTSGSDVNSDRYSEVGVQEKNAPEEISILVDSVIPASFLRNDNVMGKLKEIHERYGGMLINSLNILVNEGEWLELDNGEGRITMLHGAIKDQEWMTVSERARREFDIVKKIRLGRVENVRMCMRCHKFSSVSTPPKDPKEFFTSTTAIIYAPWYHHFDRKCVCGGSWWSVPNSQEKGEARL
ncbi:hypothetical protein BKA69DRAFT_1076585 [Paraphysoderma sedebokerense]|nr:hypothetical protein BKA69DRAFT_1076585 [Paraphysoderma sedebokerense]